MEQLTPEQAADLLVAADIHQSDDFGHAIVHHGLTDAGRRFVLVNDWLGCNAITYGT